MRPTPCCLTCVRHSTLTVATVPFHPPPPLNCTSSHAHTRHVLTPSTPPLPRPPPTHALIPTPSQKKHGWSDGALCNRLPVQPSHCQAVWLDPLPPHHNGDTSLRLRRRWSRTGVCCVLWWCMMGPVCGWCRCRLCDVWRVARLCLLAIAQYTT